MKKFFSFTIAIFMPISMVGLVGCNGLWDFDDDDDLSVMPVSFSFVGKLNLGAVTNNMRAATIGDPTVYTGNVYYEGDSSTALNINPITVDNVGSFTADFPAIDGKTFYIVFTSSAGGLKLYRYFNKTKADMDNYDASNAAIVNEETTAVGIILQSDNSKKYGDVKETDVSDVTSDVAKIVALINAMGDVSTNPLTVIVDTVAIDQTGPISLEFDKTTTLTATVSPTYATNKTVTWSSSNTAVATVDSAGVVTAGTTEGTANITATAGGVNSTALVVNVTSAPVAPVAVTGISVADASVAVDSNVTLTATITPGTATDKTVTWSSGNTSVAAVNPSTGVVEGKSAGTAVITATANDGSGVTGTCTVTVTAVVNEVANVTFDNTVSGVFDQVFKIEITGHPATFTTTSTSVTIGGSSVNVVKSNALSSATTIALAINDLGIAPKTIEDFNSLTFSPAIPKGSTVVVKDTGTGSVVATSNNIPAN